MKKLVAMMLAALMLITCFAACGNDSVDTGSTTGNNALNDEVNATAGSAASEATEEATNDNSSSINSIVVGYTIYEPMNYYDGKEFVGFDTDLAKAVFTNLGYEVIFQEIEWSAKYTELNSGTIDCIWNGFTCNTADDDGIARADKVDFSYNYMENRQVVVVKKGSDIKTIEDMKGKFAAVEGGSAGETYATGIDANIVLTKCLKQTECLTEVLSGNVDYAVLDAQLAKSYVGKGDYADLEVVDALSSDVEYYAIGFKQGSDLTAKVNAELEKLAAEGVIAALAEKYGVSNTAITDFSDQK